MNDDLMVDFSDYKKTVPDHLFGKYYGYHVRKLLYHSKSSIAGQDQLPVELNPTEALTEAQVAGYDGQNGYYQVF